MFFDDDRIKQALASGEVRKVAEVFNGSDYEQGELEDIQATLKNVTRGVSQLLLALIKRGVLTVDDAFEILREAN